MTNVLVAYGSKRGSTAEIAEFVAGLLRDSGPSVDQQTRCGASSPTTRSC
ncbi:MAG: hypothetical protein ACLP8S_12835 [Solirubrobacteraceae bacterium]